jgi:hypothetical protein
VGAAQMAVSASATDAQTITRVECSITILPRRCGHLGSFSCEGSTMARPLQPAFPGDTSEKSLGVF